MKSKLKKFCVVLMMLATLVPSAYADAEGDNNQSTSMQTAMYVMMGGMMVWMVYRLTSGNSYANLEEFQQEYRPLAPLKSEQSAFTVKTNPLPQQEKVEVVLFNYAF